MRPEEERDLAIAVIPRSMEHSLNTSPNNIVIDLDVEFPRMTREEAEDFARSLQGKKVYVIDRNDMTANALKLFEVRVFVPLEY